MDSRAGNRGLIEATCFESDLKHCGCDHKELDRAVSAFLDYIEKGRPRGMALSAQFRAVSLNKGDFACAKSRRGWLEAWLKNARQRFVRKADVLKSLKSRKHFYVRLCGAVYTLNSQP